MSVNSKMTMLADEIRELSGTTKAMGLDAMTTHVGEANTDITTEASLINQITNALEGKASSSSGIPEFSTVRVYMNDVHLSDYYSVMGQMWDTVDLQCSYIDDKYKQKDEILFDNYNTNTLNKSEVIFTVPTNSTIVLNFTRMMNHYIDTIVSSIHNELHNMKNHAQITFSNVPEAKGGGFQLSIGGIYRTIPIWGDTEIKISEFDNI